MITGLKIKGFRCFNDFSLRDLGRINLLVGLNNGGKTSVLEAIQFLTFQGNFMPLYNAMMTRGEYLWPDSRTIGPDRDLEIDICRLFHDYKIETGSKITIHGKRNGFGDEAWASIDIEAMKTPTRQMDSFGGIEAGKQRQTYLFDHNLSTSPRVMTLTWHNKPEPFKESIPLSRQGGISFKRLEKHNLSTPGSSGIAVFLSSTTLPVDNIVSMFEDIVLTSEEQLVIESMRIIEPAIERIASIGSERKIVHTGFPGIKGGLAVKCKGIERRIPIGSMGDGIWRMLSVSLALAAAKGGILLMDDIDTGLHFTVMENMWKLITKAAGRLDVQVFATTHNSDCWKSLAAVLRDEDAMDDSVSIQRIEKEKNQAVAFTKDEIIIAAEREIEVR